MKSNWDIVWEKKKVDSDYTLKLYDFLKNISKGLPKNARILEAGCGCGEGLSSFKGKITYGLDLSEKSIKLAKRYTPNPILGDIFDMPFKEGFFDLVYNSGVIEHFKYPTNVASVKEMARVTKKRGKVIIIVPNRSCLFYQFFKWLSRRFNTWDFGYEEDYTIKRLRNVVEKAGLRVNCFFGLQALPPLATNNTQLLPRFLRIPFIYLEKLFPFKQYYAYGLGVICEKR